MDLGLFSLMTIRDNPDGYPGVLADMRRMVEAVEEIGFDVAWFAEHHFANYSTSPSPLMMAAYAAGWTHRIKLGTAVIVLPLYHPLRVAQEIAVLDLQSEGRAVIGIGTGYQQFEFTRFGIKIEDKNEIFLEYWDIVERALTEGVVEHRGRHITVPRTTVAIKSVQKPLPPLFVTSSQPNILARFRHMNAVPFLAASTLGSPVLYKMVDGLRANLTSIGIEPTSKPPAVMQYVHVTDSRAEALEAGERARYLGRLAHHLRHGEPPMDGTMIRDEPFPGEQTIEEYADNIVAGDAHRVAERMVADIRRVGPVHYACNFQFGCMPIERASRSLARFARDVVPLIERELGPIRDIGKTPAHHKAAAE